MPDQENNNLTSVFGFEVDVGQVLRNLNSDLFDEWFYDCLNYQDLLRSKSQVVEIIKGQIGKGHGRYPPQQRIVRNIPKKGLPIRYSLETDFFDRFAYQAICTFLIKFYDPLLSHRVLSHRYSKHSKKYLFQNRIERWFTYEGVTFTFKKDQKYLLVTDLANYFENIRNKDILGSFEELLPEIKASPDEKQQIRNALDLLGTCLESWSFADGFGLSQNRDPSSFLANVVLCSIDRKIAGLGYDYYRYVDDIRIICQTQDSAKKAMVDLISCLRERGLNVNSAKTTILGPESTEDEIAAEFPNRDPRVVAIEQMWKSKSKAIILKSIKYLIALLVECIELEQTQSRQFRFAANRLAQLSDIGVLSAKQLGGPLTSLLVESMFEQPASTDQYCKILNLLGIEGECSHRIQTFLKDRDRAIHDWQNYHLWMLLAKKSIKSNDLRFLALSIVKAGLASAEAGAIIIWADQVGYKSVLNAVLSQFDAGLPFQVQRYLAIATRNYPSSKLKHVYPLASDRIRGTRELAKGFENENGKVEFPKREVAIKDLFDEVSEYD